MADTGKAKEFLINWIKGHIKNRDLMARSIESVEDNKNGFDVYVKHKDKEQFVIAIPIIEDINEILSKLQNKDGVYTIVTFNTHKNFKALLNNWDTLAEFSSLNMFFVNPFSNTDKRWIIYPYTHNRICDKASLSKGLKSMFDMVDPISEEEIKKQF